MLSFKITYIRTLYQNASVPNLGSITLHPPPWEIFTDETSFFFGRSKLLDPPGSYSLGLIQLMRLKINSQASKYSICKEDSLQIS